MQGDMPFQCSKCGKTLEKNECYEHQGKVFCEDCYMDILSPPKACDPWAVHSAKTFLRGKDKLSTLTPLQLKIVNHIKEHEADFEVLQGPSVIYSPSNRT
jgi:DNA-directed RNA polymerase subunit RPC12/RpoP